MDLRDTSAPERRCRWDRELEPERFFFFKQKTAYEFAVAGDVERGHADRRARPRGEQRPVAVDVAVPVEPAAEAGARELARVEVQVPLGQPGRPRARLRPARDEPSAARHHAVIARLHLAP